MSDEEDQRWQAYLWASDSGEPMLANRYGLRDEAALREREYAETALRATELQLGRVDIAHTRDLGELQAVHAHLFGNVYDWAGQLRTVEMVKGGDEFVRPADFEPYLAAVFDQASAIDWAGLDRELFVADTSWLFMHLNWAHPFREGNGRATRLFVDRFTAAASWRLDFTRIPSAGWNLACHDASPRTYEPPRDPGLLARAISAVTTPRAVPEVSVGGPARRGKARTLRAPFADADTGHTIGAAIRHTGLTAPRTTTPAPAPPTAPEPASPPDTGPGL